MLAIRFHGDKRGGVDVLGVGNGLPQETADDMLKQSDCLDLDKASNHVAQDGADGVEAFVGGADVVQTGVVEEDFLHDENGDCF